jgi:alkylated DNA repair dioxygenase AlkB
MAPDASRSAASPWNAATNTHIHYVKSSAFKTPAATDPPTDLFGEAATPPGFRAADALFSAAEEKAFVRQFETLPFMPFEFHGHLGNRRIVSFGYRYDYGAQKLKSSDAMPEFLLPLRAIASTFSGIPDAQLEQALVTEYAPGAGIGWHRDKPMFEKVVALSFLAPCDLRLRRKAGDRWERRSVSVAPRSGYLLNGPVRDEWEHSIVPMEKLRYSVTFRSFRPATGQRPT